MCIQVPLWPKALKGRPEVLASIILECRALYRGLIPGQVEDQAIQGQEEGQKKCDSQGSHEGPI